LLYGFPGFLKRKKSKVNNKSIAVRIKEYLGLKKDIVYLLAITAVILTGEKTWERFIPKYIQSIGATVLIIGMLGFLRNLLNAVWALQGGYIADKFGSRKSFFMFSLMAIAGYLIAIVFTNWIAVFIGMLFFSAWSSVALPASLSLIKNELGREKTAMGISIYSITARMPMAIGPLIGGLLIANYGLITGIKIAFAISIVLCIIGILFQQKLSAPITPQHQPLHPFQLWKKMDKRLKNMLVSDILVRFCEQIPYVFVVIWCLDIAKISPKDFGVLTAIEMIVATLIYIPVANFSDKLERKPFIVITFIFFTFFPIILNFSMSWMMLVIAFIVRGLKEFGEPTRKAMIMDFAIEKAQARTVGVYYFIRDFIVSLAALLGGWLWKIGPNVNLITAAIFGVAGTLFFIVFGKGTDRTFAVVAK